MYKRILYLSTILLVSTASVMTACNKEAGPAADPINYSYVEEFDTLANAMARGWAVSNNSQPIGISSWEQGKLLVEDPIKKALVNNYPFLAASATYSGKDFVIAGYNSGSGTSTLSVWLISPSTLMKNGDKIRFFTRTVPTSLSATTPDRLQVWLNPLSNSVNTGARATATGDFTVQMLDINPTYLSAGTGSYPREWTQYELTISGLPAPVERRFAFRYFVEQGGPAGANSYGVGIDKVEFISQ